MTLTDKPEFKKTPFRGFDSPGIKGYTTIQDDKAIVNTDLMLCDLIACYKAAGNSQWQVIDRLCRMWPSIEVHHNKEVETKH
jgi:hypothetical protein